MYCPLYVALLLFPATVELDDKIDAKLLVGKWEPDKLPDTVVQWTLELLVDKKVALEIRTIGENHRFEGTYEMDGSTLILTLESNGARQIQKRKVVKLTEKELVTKDDDSNQERKYKKVK
jgi:uncharacterized protein (TIGR03066 family)